MHRRRVMKFRHPRMQTNKFLRHESRLYRQLSRRGRARGPRQRNSRAYSHISRTIWAGEHFFAKQSQEALCFQWHLLSEDRSGDSSRQSVSVQRYQWKTPYARRCQYRTAHRRRASAVAACALETRALFCRGPSRAKAGTRAADPESRALETDASGLNRRLQGSWVHPFILHFCWEEPCTLQRIAHGQGNHR